MNWNWRTMTSSQPPQRAVPQHRHGWMSPQSLPSWSHPWPTPPTKATSSPAPCRPQIPPPIHHHRPLLARRLQLAHHIPGPPSPPASPNYPPPPPAKGVPHSKTRRHPLSLLPGNPSHTPASPATIPTTTLNTSSSASSQTAANGPLSWRLPNRYARCRR